MTKTKKDFYNDIVVKPAENLVEAFEKHNIGVINSRLRPILHKYREGEISLTIVLGKIHIIFKEVKE